MGKKEEVKQAHILIKGDKIQKVGFRDYVRDLAVKYRLVGEIHNINNYDRDVKVICEGDLENIRVFIKEIEALKEKPTNKKKPTITKAKELLISVDKVDPTFYNPERIYKDFTVIRSSDEFEERIYDGFRQLQALRIENQNNFNLIGNRFDILDEEYGKFSKLLEDMPKRIAEEIEKAINKK